MANRIPPQAIAARILGEVVLHGRYLDSALRDAALGAGDPAALIQEMVYGVARHFFRLTAITRELLERPLKPADSDLQLLLLTGLYQLRDMRTPVARAVNETVAAAVTLGKPWAKGLINACLRNYQRRRDDLETRAERDEEARYDHPRWLIEKFRGAWPQDWERIVAANNRRPPLWLRVNRQRSNREAVLDCFAAQHIDAQPVDEPDSALLVDPPRPVHDLPGFSAGLVSVQDAAAQFAAGLLETQPGERVLDACAAPGGKTAHLLERTPGLELLALELVPERVLRIRENLDRLGLHAEVRRADATRPEDWWDGRAFDRILLDAPCSATGVIRRHPDIKLRRKNADLPRLLATQRALLDSLWPLLKPGGKLLYVTCSILPDENERQINRFLGDRDSARIWSRPLPAGRACPTGHQLLPGDPLPGPAAASTDGFYYAGIEKLA